MPHSHQPQGPDQTQHHHEFTSEHPRDSVEHWEERYGGEPVWSGHPNGALTAEVADLEPGRALDVGCGEGADSVWLAQQGWQVTALDISSRAVARTQAAAERAGVSVRGIAQPLLEADLEPGSFELVSAMYPVLSHTEDHQAEARLMNLVAPGGTLLFVHHELDPAHTHDGFDPSKFVSPQDMRQAIGTGWEVVTEERRERHVVGGAGAGHTTDLVVRARRLS